MAIARLVITGLLIITPIFKYLREPTNRVYALGFTVTAIAFFAAVTVWMVLRRGRYATWVGFVSSGIDVSLVTMALVLFYAAAGPLAGINSKVTFEVYFLCLAATALRYDARICATAGGLAMAQYGAIWAFALWHDPEGLVRSGENGYVAADQITRLILLGSSTAIAMLLVSRAQALQHSAATDPLTGIGNRGHFDRRAHAEHERARRYKRHLAIALVDVDHFKQFNDVHGHGVGDTVLITVGSLLNRNLRRSDTLARYGGEEFALVLPEATLEAARAKVDLIRRTIEITTLDLPDDREPQRLTISAGIAVYPEDGNTIELLVAVADDRLLAAKRAGRNRVMITDEVAEAGA